MADAIRVTFTWPPECSTPDLLLSMPAAALADRDPDATCLLAAKKRFAGSSEFTMSVCGPGEGEFMSATLIRFIWEYIRTGSLAVTPELEAADCEWCVHSPRPACRARPDRCVLAAGRWPSLAS